MNEKQWLALNTPSAMLAYIGMRGLGTQRTIRLFAVACCQRITRLIPNNLVLTSIQIAEAFADGTASLEMLENAAARTWDTHLRNHGDAGARSYATLAVHYLCGPLIEDDLIEMLRTIESATICDPDDPENEPLHQANLARDIFGNPFRPVAFATSWRSTDAVGLARSMYDARDFAAMPILADGLEEAGCDSAEILAHCRSDGPHVRGCWVVDLVLGKA